MKKSTLLSLLTTAAIIITTAGTYATWDVIEDDTSAKITFRNPVTVNVAESYKLTQSDPTFKETPSATGDVNFTVSNHQSGLARHLKLTPSIFSSDSPDKKLDSTDFNISIKHKSTPKESLSSEGDSLSSQGGSFIDTSLDTTQYTVTVTPNNSKYAGKELTVKLDALLE